MTLIVSILLGLLLLLMYAIIAYIRDIAIDYGYSYDTFCGTCGAFDSDRANGGGCDSCRSIKC